MRIAEIEIEYTGSNGEKVVETPTIRLREQPVKGIVNLKKQKVRFKELADGTLEWDKKATPDIIKIGNAMARTPTGLQQLKILDNAQYPIQMIYDLRPENARGGVFAVGFGGANRDVVLEAQLVVFHQAILYHVTGLRGKPDLYIGTASRHDILLGYFARHGRIEEILGAYGGHEAEHARISNLNLRLKWKNNPDLSLEEREYPYEIEPYKIQAIILEEEYNMLSDAERRAVDEEEASIISELNKAKK